MRAHYLQHVPFEGLGGIEAWIDSAGWEKTCTRFFAGDGLPVPESIDLLVIMGGPMSVNDEEEFPWLAEEKRFIRRVVELEKPVLGVCLGAQLIAASLGARIYPNEVKEIGWYPVCRVDPAASGSFCFPEEITVFHWHGETFDLPAGAVHLARSAGCRHQAFQYGRSVIGLQFHLETTPQSARLLVENCRQELAEARYVQGEQEIMAAEPERFTVIHRLLDDILGYLVHNSSSR